LYTFKNADTTWFLEDPSLKHVVEHLALEPKDKRAHFIREHNNGKIFIKFFHERGLPGLIRNRVLPRGKKEYELSNRLRLLDVFTPRALGYGISTNGSYALHEWIEGEPLINWIDDPKRRQQLLSSLVWLLQELKAKGVRHNDLHLANIIGSSVKLYLVDLHSVTVKRTFTLADDVSNTTHALAMIYEGMDEVEKQWFFGHYGGNALRTAVEEELGRFKKRWVTRKAARAFRTTSVLDAAGDRVSVRGMEGQAQGAWVATIKKDRKVTVERYADHVRKTYTHARRLHRAWKNHVILEYMHLSMAPQAYYLQQASSSRPGFIAMEDLTGKGEELDRFLDRNYDGMSRAGQRGLVDTFSSCLVSALKKGITHRDLKACNIFVLQRGVFLLLDVEDLAFSGFDEDALKRMLIQLNTTIPKRVSLRDRLRVFSRIMRTLSLDGKRLLKEIASESRSREIVYEGVGGLKRESWG
jgi:tRNA A-37 threonylcarbamoyl transferase component Bud32